MTFKKVGKIFATILGLNYKKWKYSSFKNKNLLIFRLPKNFVCKTTQEEGTTTVHWMTSIRTDQMFTSSSIRPSSSSSSSTLLLVASVGDVRWRENTAKNIIGIGGRSNGKKEDEWRQKENWQNETRIRMDGGMKRRRRRIVGEEIGEWEQKQNWRRKTIERQSHFGALLFGAFLLLIPPQLEAIRCYCTGKRYKTKLFDLFHFSDEHCVPYGVCEANVCLVGLLRSSNAGLKNEHKNIFFSKKSFKFRKKNDKTSHYV